MANLMDRFLMAGLTLWGTTLYGMTYYGGANGKGTVFKLDTEDRL